MTRVVNLKTKETRDYPGLSPYQAVILAYESSRGNSRWAFIIDDWENHTQFKNGKVSVTCGDWCALKEYKDQDI